jgi:hypothetical protein
MNDDDTWEPEEATHSPEVYNDFYGLEAFDPDDPGNDWDPYDGDDVYH